MLTYREFETYDRNGMYKVYDKWPELARKFYDMKYDAVDFKGINHIIFVGMGGSGALGDVLSAIFSKTNMHLCVVKGYHLPKTANSRTLVVASSVSGNTLETLTVLKEAKKLGSKTLAFSSGGKMEAYCLKNKIEYRKVPLLNSPRASFPIYLYSILKVLEPLVPLKKNDINESISFLEKTRKQISYSNLTHNPSLDLAKWLSGIPIIYYPAGLQAAAVRFKNSLQENCKIHAAAEDVIEACHNSIVSWETKSNVRPILIQGKNDYSKTKKLWRIIKTYFKINQIDFKEIHSIDGNILSKLICLIYLMDYATIYYAVLNKKDPTPINSIEFVKNRMYNE